MDLTKAILTLDKESASALKNEKTSNLKEKDELKRYVQKIRGEAIALFEDQKSKDSTELDLQLEQERLEAITELRRKMKTYDKKVDIDKLAEHLFSLVKEQACH